MADEKVAAPAAPRVKMHLLCTHDQGHFVAVEVDGKVVGEWTVERGLSLSVSSAEVAELAGRALVFGTATAQQLVEACVALRVAMELAGRALAVIEQPGEKVPALRN